MDLVEDEEPLYPEAANLTELQRNWECVVASISGHLLGPQGPEVMGRGALADSELEWLSSKPEGLHGHQARANAAVKGYRSLCQRHGLLVRPSIITSLDRFTASASKLAHVAQEQGHADGQPDVLLVEKAGGAALPVQDVRQGTEDELVDREVILTWPSRVRVEPGVREAFAEKLTSAFAPEACSQWRYKYVEDQPSGLDCLQLKFDSGSVAKRAP